MHALWIEWRTQLIQTQAALALAGVSEEIEADPHAAFADFIGASPPSAAQAREARRLEIEALMAAAT